MPLAAIAGIGAIGSIGSALIGSNSASNAASAQQKAAQQAAQLQLQGSNNALNYQNGIYNQTQQNLAPWLQAGGGALNNLSYLLGISPNTSLGGTVAPAQGINPNASPTSNAMRMTGALPGVSAPSLNSPSAPNPTGGPIASPLRNVDAPVSAPMLNAGSPTAHPVAAGSTVAGTSPGAAPSTGGFGSLTQGYGQTFQAPTAEQFMQSDPGLQAGLKLGTDAIQRSAAARGNVLTGGTAKALDQFGQDYGSTKYDDAYNRALQTFGTNYGVWNNDQNNIYSRLLGLSGAGQSAANSLGAFGQESSNNVTGNLLGTGQQIGADYGAGAAANASGIYNSGAAWQGALGGIGGNLSQLLMLKQLGLGGGSNSGAQSLANLQSNQAWGNPGIYQSPTLSYGIEG